MKVVNFLKTIQNSIYSPSFYSTVLTKSFKQSIGYFLLLILLLTMIRSVILVNPLLIEAPKTLEGFAKDVINCFPKDLEIKISSGQVSVNTTEPYFISSCEGDRQQLVVIDTKTPYTSGKFDEYKVAAWVTKDSVTYKRNDYETRSYSLTQIKDFKLNRETLNSYYEIITPYIKFIGPVLTLLAFIGFYFAYNFRLIHLLLISSLIWLLGKIFKSPLTYGQSYKVNLYAITLGLIVELVLSLTGKWTGIYGFPFMVSVLTLSVVTVNLFYDVKRVK